VGEADGESVLIDFFGLIQRCLFCRCFFAGGQEKLRPLWKSYTRCTDAIVFVVDSVDVERMEEAKMELMRTAKSPDNAQVFLPISFSLFLFSLSLSISFLFFYFVVVVDVSLLDFFSLSPFLHLLLPPQLLLPIRCLFWSLISDTNKQHQMISQTGNQSQFI